MLGCGSKYLDTEFELTLSPTITMYDEMQIDKSNSDLISKLRGGRMKPLRMKQVSKIMSAVSGEYTSFSREQQFKVSNLVLKLLEVMCLTRRKVLQSIMRTLEYQ
jgi:hypothetical protein